MESTAAINILNILKILDGIFGVRAAEITNRASVVSIYLLIEEMFDSGALEGKEEDIRDFYLEFLEQLRDEVRLGIDATSRFLLLYQSRIIQAADTRASIGDRHDRLKEALRHYFDSGTILR